MIVHQAEGLSTRRPSREPIVRRGSAVLAIVSGKGGVGKSTLAVNLAAAAARAGGAPLLIDGDVGLANADLLLGLVPRHDLGDCDASAIALAEVLCPGPAGLELLVVGSRRSAVARLARGLVGDAAEPLSALVASRALTLLDLGAGIGANVIDLARHCDPVWLVATPEPTSLADAYATVKRLWERAPRLRIELVVNRVADRAAGERTHRALERLVQRFLGRALPLRAVLPEDPAMGESVARQRPVVFDAPHSPVGRRIGLLAESLVEELSNDGSSGLARVDTGGRP